MRALAAAAALALLSAPAAAEPVTAGEVWDIFARTCTQALETPADTTAIDTASGGRALAGTTPDDWGVQGVVTFEEIDLGDSGGVFVVNYTVVSFPEGTMGFCTAQVIRTEAGPVEGMEAVIDARHAELVPGATRYGGPISADGQSGIWVSYASAAFPPDAVSLRTFEPVTLLSLNRFLD